MKRKFKLWTVLFFLGFVGVLSTLTMDIIFPEKIQKIIDEQLTFWEFKLIMIINPSILLLIFTILGTIFYDKVGFKLPIFERLIWKNKIENLKEIFRYGILGGLLVGSFIAPISIVSLSFLPKEFIQLSENFKPGIVTRVLYGGVTEEILVRFGLMSLLVWIGDKLVRGQQHFIYWIGIVTSSILFGFGHLPIVFTLIEAPSTELLLYVIFGNAIGGIVFGWLYWKKGLESAMIAHIVTHLVVFIGENLFS